MGSSSMKQTTENAQNSESMNESYRNSGTNS